MENNANRIIGKTLTMKRMSLAFAVLFVCSVVLIFVFTDLSTEAEFKQTANTLKSKPVKNKILQSVKDITPPEGFERIKSADSSFSLWLQNFPISKNNNVYLYNGQLKADQTSHFAVLDISTGKKDLQQCADAIMRLRAEYFLEQKAYDKIQFSSSNKTFKFSEEINRSAISKTDMHNALLLFMDKVFTNCGTYTVEEMTKRIKMSDMQPGDVFVKAGAPGHAMIVVDVAINKTNNRKIYLLAQSFMPAQNMHIVINPGSEKLSPWYEVVDNKLIHTPGYTFTPNQLKRFN